MGESHGFIASKRRYGQGDSLSPLLFVIFMEYLARILAKMSALDQYHHHPRCSSIKLTHLSFADDLILCSKGDFASVYLLLRAFRLFSQSSGLKTNAQKSALYCCGKNEEDISRIKHVLGIMSEYLPFRYLGVPINAKRITAAKCDCLVDKMTAKIRVPRISLILVELI